MSHIHQVLLVLATLLTGCALTHKATNFNGLNSVDGPAPVHINVTEYALHLFVVQPFLGNATLENGVDEFTDEAKKMGKSRVRIVQSSETRLWWILPPFSLILTPAWTNVAGDAVP